MVVIDNFSNFGWTVPMKSKKTQTLNDYLENILINSKGKPYSLRPSKVKNFITIFFFNLLINNNFKQYSRNSSLVAVFAKRFNRTYTNLLEKPVFERAFACWIDLLPVITKQKNYRVHTSSKLTPVQGKLKKKQGCVYKIFLYKRKKLKPKFQINDLVKATDLKKTFSKSDTTN